MLIKICGITSPETAVACFEAGTDLIGLVHYPPSPRHVDETRICEILDSVEPFRKTGRQAVLVVADQLPTRIDSRIDLIQSYGKKRFNIPTRRIHVVKDRKTFDRLLLLSAKNLNPDPRLNLRGFGAFIASLRKPLGSNFVRNTVESSAERECPLHALELSRGILPGGNGAAWDWSVAKPFCARYPTILAGGITPENVIDAVELAEPCGIDVSSGVESAPGIKDLDKVRRLIEKVRNRFI